VNGLKSPKNNSLTRGTPLFKFTALELCTPSLAGFSILFLFKTIAHPVEKTRVSIFLPA
jgi:hypothetical protein